MTEDNVQSMKVRLVYLEGKCAFLTKQLEDILLTNMGAPSPANFAEIDRLRSHNYELMTELNRLRNSNSVRLTKPLRELRLWVRTFFQR